MHILVVITKDIKCIVLRRKVQLIKSAKIKGTGVTVVQIGVVLKLVNELPQNLRNSEWKLTLPGDESLSYSLCEFDIPSGSESRPSKSAGEYDWPMDQVPAVGSPVKVIAITARAAANSGPRL